MPPTDPKAKAPAKKKSAATKSAKKKTATKKTAAKKTATKKAVAKKAAAKKTATKKTVTKKAATKKVATKKVAKKAVTKVSSEDAAPAKPKATPAEPKPTPKSDVEKSPESPRSEARESRDDGGNNQDNEQRRDQGQQNQERQRDRQDQRDRQGQRGRKGRDQQRDGGGRRGRDGQRNDNQRNDNQRNDGQRNDNQRNDNQLNDGGQGERRGRRRQGNNPVRGRVRGKGRGRNSNSNNERRGNRGRERRDNDESRETRTVELTGDPVAVDGLLEIAPKGFGFLRRPEKDFEQSQEDVFVPPDILRKHHIRVGTWVKGVAREGARGMQLTEVTKVNDMDPDTARKLPAFEELKATNPTKRIAFETTPDRYTTRVVDIIAPIGRGQRGLIVSPPRSGKTTFLLHLAQAVRERHEETLKLIVLLVDERPEEVTEFKRQLPDAEIYSSSNDMPTKNHCRLAELCIERAKRLVEAGEDVFLLMDSITRLARAYNNSGGGGGGRGYQSGGIVAGALEMPRRLFAAARKTKEAGSLTIIGTALIQTNSKADEAIFQEFKGTGNMELVLDRKIAENFVFPAVEIFKSGTRREELLLPEHTLHKIHLIRRGLSGHRSVEAMERLLFFLKKFPNNAQMLLEIKG